MIRKLDSHNKANFTTAEGKQPYFNKYTTPITLLEYANSVSNVRNTGIDAKWYLDGTDLLWKSTVFAGRVPFTKFYYGNGVPEVFTRQNMIKNWGVQYTGYFRPPVTSKYTFYAGGEGLIQHLQIGAGAAAHIMTGRKLMLSAVDYVKSTTLSLSTDTWYPFDIRYRSNYLAGNQAGLVLMWQSSVSTVSPEKILFSAGVATDSTHKPLYASSEVVPFKNVPFFSKTSYNETENGINSVTFELPLIDSSLSYNTEGWFYHRPTDSYIEKSTYTKIQKYRNIRYSEGYRTNYKNSYAIKYPTGGSNNYVSVPYSATLNCNSGITCETWVKLAAGISGGAIVFLPAAATYVAPYADFAVYIDSGVLGAYMRPGVDNYVTPAPATLNDGNWHHIVFTADGTKWKFYVDGVLRLSVNTTALPTHTTGDYDMKIGMFTGGTYEMQGSIDELRLYNRAITFDEVLKSYNYGRGSYKPYDTTQLKLWYHFDEVSGSITDWSGNGNTGSIVGIISKTTGKVTFLDEYVHKFTGTIRDLKVGYSKEGGDILKVTCYDFGSFTKDNINLVSPSPIDYWQAGYLTKISSRVDGYSKPRAFDGWEIDKAYRVLLTESWIDPYTFYKKYDYVDYSNVATAGPFLIEPIQSSVKSFLPIKSNYGQVTITRVDGQKSDDEYAYKIDTGEYYKDAIDNIMKTWYYQWGFNCKGYPFLKRINVPMTYVDDRQFTFRPYWSSATNIDAYKASYIHTSNATNASCNVTGSKFLALFGVGPDCGNVQVYLRKGATAVRNMTYNTYNATSYFYYSGPDPLTAVNYCQLMVATQVPYDTYRLAVVAPGTTKVKFDGVLCYHEGHDSPNEYFYTGDVSTAGTVGSLDLDVTLEDQRTDCIVLGSRTGTRVVADEVANFSAANPNNPIYTYIQSSSRDINAIYKATASNYLGHPKMMIIQDPAIVSQDQADFVSFNVINEYGTPAKKVELTVQGHPKIEVGDCITVFDNSKQITSTADYAWVTEVSNEAEAGLYTTKLQTTPVTPVSSYWEKVEPDLSLFNWNPIQNFKIYNGGGIGTLSMDLASTYKGAGSKLRFSGVNTDHIAPKGFVKIRNEIIKYDTVSTPGTTYTYNGKIVRELRTLTRGLQLSGVATSHASAYAGRLTPISLAYDPYIQESLGYAPIIQFDCLVNGEIEVAIFSAGNNAFGGVYKFAGNDVRVDTLTGIGNDGYPYQGYDPVRWGKNKTYLWGAFDQIGDYNNYGNGPYQEPINKGYYVIEQYNYKPGTPNSTCIPYGLFYVQINIKPQNAYNVKTRFYSTDIHTNPNSSVYGYMYTRRGDPGLVDIIFDTSDVYMVKPTEKTAGGANRGYWYRRSLGDGFVTNPLASVLPVSTIPYTTYKEAVGDSNHAAGTQHQADSFFINKSNSNKGVKFRFVHKYADKDLSRTYFANVGYKIYQMTAFTYDQSKNDNIGADWSSFTNIVDGNLSDLYPDMSFSTSAIFTFNVKDLANKKEDFDYIPKKIKNEFIANNLWEGKIPAENADKILIVSNILLFYHNVRDLSGRTCIAPNRYETIKKPYTITDSQRNQVVFALGQEIPVADRYAGYQYWYELYNAGLLYKSVILAYYYKYNNNTYPFHWTGTATGQQRGGYEFIVPKGKDSWIASFLDKNNYGQWESKYVVFDIDKNFQNEVKYGRKNWIQWVDDTQVSRMIYNDMAGVLAKTKYIEKDRNAPAQGNEYIFPNIWSLYYLTEFRAVGT